MASLQLVDRDADWDLEVQSEAGSPQLRVVAHQVDEELVGKADLAGSFAEAIGKFELARTAVAGKSVFEGGRSLVVSMLGWEVHCMLEEGTQKEHGVLDRIQTGFAGIGQGTGLHQRILEAVLVRGNLEVVDTSLLWDCLSSWAA